ncbi:MAG: FkbM family methyltransferase [Oscillospiraceae bacterium]|nr:FkbM family methyltransferase [Oscillospiraceae bacterium]
MQDNHNTFFLWEYLQSCNKPIILFGTGDGADKVLAVMGRYGLTPACFTATGDFGLKPAFRGYEVLPVATVREKYPDAVLLLCFGSDKPEVLDKIAEAATGFELYVPDLPVTGEPTEIYTPDYMSEHAEQIAKARKLFERSGDKKSLQVFDGWLQYRLSGKADILEQIATPREELLAMLKLKAGDKIAEGEFFIDAGAFKGDTVEEFIALTQGKFARVVAIEPDISNYTLLRRKFYAYGSELFVPVHGAAWNTDEMLTFAVKSGKAGFVQLAVMGKEVAGRTVSVQGVTVDSLAARTPDLKPTYIKIDVEGAEEQVLLGGRETIAKHRPRMLLSLYHRSADLFKLPLLVHEMYSGYKFALRKTRCLPGWEFQLIVTK